MKSTAIILASLIGSTMVGPIRAQQSQGAVPGPGIVFSDRSFDFGKVIVGEIVKHTFTFTNCGNELLEVLDVKTTCGCTSAGQWSHQVPPGGTGTIPLEFHTDHFNGPVLKTATVVCNIKGQREVELQLKGIVWHPIDLVPVSAAFAGALQTSASLTRIIHITNREDRPLILGRPVSNHRSIDAELVTNIFGTSYELTVKLLPPLGAGNVFGEINIPTSSTNLSSLKIPVWAVAQPAVMVLPPQVEIPPGPFTNILTRSISVRNNGATPLELSDLRLNADGIDAKLYELKKGELFTIQLLFREGFRGGQPIEVTFKSNNPKFPLLKVPVAVR